MPPVQMDAHHRPPPKAYLFSRLCQPAELERSWQEVLAHYKKDSIPNDLREFDRRRGREIDRLARELREHQFLPEPASLIFIPKPNHPNEKRPITLIKPDDRIVLTLLSHLVEPLFERQFLPHSYAYRKGRGAVQAVDRVEHCLRQGLAHTASGDIDEFFASLHRPYLLERIRRTIWEQPVLDLLETYLHMGATRSLQWVESDRGIAQGSPLSPLLSNIYLLEFDRHIDSLGVEWVRYADNFILLAQEPAIARQAFDRAESFLRDRAALHLNPESRLFASSDEGFDFLGFWFQQGRRTIAASKMDQKRAALSEMFRQNRGNLERLVEEVSETALGWRHYYGASTDTLEQRRLLDQQIFDLFIPWLQKLRSTPGFKRPAADLKAVLLPIELSAETDVRRKLKWVELLLVRSRPNSEEPARSAVSPQARRAIDQRKQEYRRKREDLEEILVSKPGVYLGRTGERLMVRRDGKRETEIPLNLIRNITLLTKAGSISAELMTVAAERGIPIVILAPDGKPAVRVGPMEAPAFHISLSQVQLASSKGGLDLARRIVAGKIRNQANLLRYYSKYPERRGASSFLADITAAIAEMETLGQEVNRRQWSEPLDHDLERNRLFAAEGQAAGVYWKAVRSLLWWKPGFEGRVRRGAGDLVNSLLNYGYGILYSRLFAILARNGLNVNIGFLHKPQPGKPGLVFDFIEEFRSAAVDRVVFSMLNLGKRYQTTSGGLDDATRHDLARQVVRRLQSDTRYHGESLPLQKVMEMQARLLVRHIEGKEEYQTWVLPW